MDKRPDTYPYILVYTRNLEKIMFFFCPSSCCPLPRTLDAKSLGHGLTRSLCVHVRPSVSNCQTIAASGCGYEPYYSCMCARASVPNSSLPAREKSVTGKNERVFGRQWKRCTPARTRPSKNLPTYVRTTLLLLLLFFCTRAPTDTVVTRV